MEIKYTIKPEELNEMRASVHWRTISLSQAEQAIDHSMINISIFESNQIVAIGRLVGDGCFKAMLTDIIVKPSYQKQGYGKRIVCEILKIAKKNMHPDEQLCIEACPTRNSRNFYIHCGFTYDPDEQDGVSIWL